MAVATVNRKQKLQELFEYGERVAAENNFTEEDVFDEIKKYRNDYLICINEQFPS